MKFDPKRHLIKVQGGREINGVDIFAASRKGRTVYGRFCERVEPSAETGCLEWTGQRFRLGYGALKVGGQNISAHRLAWMMCNGPIADGLVVMHTCDNRGCVNPDHLRLGTQLENIRDRDRKGRQRAPRGERSPMAKMTTATVRRIRELRRNGLTQVAVARTLGITKHMVKDVCRGKTWKQVAEVSHGV